MISGFIYVGREALELVFLTYLLIGALSASTVMILAAVAGIVTGIGVGYLLGDLLEPYEWATYGVLSLLMLYLFVNSKKWSRYLS